MKTLKKMTFKEVPFIEFFEKGDDEDRLEAHYKCKIRKIAVDDDIKYERDEDEDDYDSYTLECKDDKPSLNLNKTIKDLINAKTIHFDGSCRVPRFKLGEICTKMGIKIIRDRDKADIIIYGNNYLNNLTITEWGDGFNYKEAFIAQAKKIKKKYNLITEVLPMVEACNSNIVMFENGSDYAPLDKLVIQKTKKKDSDIEFNLSYEIIEDEEKYKYLIGDNNLLHQDVILENLSSIVIDEQMYRSICAMFESPSKENHIVAMELMSNTAYKTSLVYLLNLIRKYHGTIFEISEKRHISFKALTEYLNFIPNDQRSLDELIDKVIERKVLTEDNYKLILQFILEEEAKSMKEDDSKWRITNVDLAPEIKAQVIWNKKEEPILEEAL